MTPWLRSTKVFAAACLAFLALPQAPLRAEPPGQGPRVLVDGYQLELVAREPDIVTPIGMAFDPKGRLLVVESHTHQRPADYKGPAGDRIRMFADTDGDGKLDRWTTFAEGYQQAMNLCMRPDGAVYLVTRRDVRLLEDTDGDGKVDKETMLLTLDTNDDYPHDGLEGIAFRATAGKGGQGKLYIGLGENHGMAYTLTGTDRSPVAGVGGSGTIFVCDQDGSHLERHANGFWNPFSMCFFGERLFTADNDPDSSPPCRLVDVVEGGDYGFRFQYGRSGIHPLQAWNGELPGTLPYVCGIGEAPTAIVPHRGWLWITSWGDHRIDRFALRMKDGSLGADCKTVVQGEADFRPTGMAVAPDGSIYFADWVDRSYPVHGKGKLWRLQIGDSKADRTPDLAAPTPAKERLLSVDARQQMDSSRAAKTQFDVLSLSEADRLGFLQYARWMAYILIEPDHQIARTQSPAPDKPLVDGGARSGDARDEAISFFRQALADPNPDVRLYAVRWIADDELTALRDDVAKLLDGPIPSERYFLAALAAIDWLDSDGKLPTSGVSDALLVRELKNDSRPAALHALALSLVSPDDKWLTIERLKVYLDSSEPAMRLAAARTLAESTAPERLPVLAEIAADEQRDPALRAQAVAGLAAAVEAHGELLEKLTADKDAIVASEAARVLRLTGKRAATTEAKPQAADLDAWSQILASGGDAEAGRRLFFMPAGPRCAACHQFQGRGGRVGPDLTHVARQRSRESIVSSILQPSREIAPAYQAWILETADGLTKAGLRLPTPGDEGVEIYSDSNGQTFKVKSEDIELRKPSDKSIMPEGLEQTMSIADLRDLVAFLTSNSETPQRVNSAAASSN